MHKENQKGADNMKVTLNDSDFRLTMEENLNTTKVNQQNENSNNKL